MKKKKAPTLTTEELITNSIDKINDLLENESEEDSVDYGKYKTECKATQTKPNKYYDWLISKIYKEHTELEYNFYDYKDQFETLGAKYENLKEETDSIMDSDKILASEPYDDQKMEILNRLMKNLNLWELEALEQQIKSTGIKYGEVFC